jgi:glycosyltransferase involved in cell wall biosynthesis
VRTYFEDNMLTRLPFESSYLQRKRDEILISIGIITCKRATYLKKSLESILPQCGLAVEIVVVVDGQDPQTIELLSLYQSPYMRIYVNEINQGRPKSRNIVIKESYGEYILWLDDDDIAKPNLVSTYLQLIELHDNIDVAYCDLEIYDMRRGIKKSILSAENVGGYGAKIIQNLISGKGITSGGSIVRRQLYLNLGGFDERMHRAQDNEFWYRAALHARFQKVHKTLYQYRLHGGNASVGWKNDISYASFALRNALKHIPLEVIYPDLNWRDPQGALSKALSKIARGLSTLGDHFSAIRFLKLIPLDYLKADDAISLLRISLIQGNSSTVLHSYEVLREQGSVNPSKIDSYRSLIDKISKLERVLTSSFRNRDKEKLRYYTREHRQILKDSFFIRRLFAKRFDLINDKVKAYRSFFFALMLQPENEEVYKWLIKHNDLAEASGFGSADDLRSRMLGEFPDEPQYVLASGKYSLSDNYYFPNVRSIFTQDKSRDEL